MGKIQASILWVLSGILFFSIGCTKNRAYGPPKEKIFRYWMEMKVPSLDPAQTTDVYSAQAQSLFYDTLFEYHYLKRPYQVVPALAESLPTISPDQKKLTIKLKRGIKFHDDACFAATQGKGREMTADDVLYMFHRVAEPKKVYPAYSLFENNIVGINDYHEGKATSIGGVKALDGYTVEINLTKPLPRFLYNFVDVKTAILPKECVEKYGEGLRNKAVGTGPFKLVSADLGSKIVAIRNPDYRTLTYPTDGNPGDKEKGLLADAGKQLPLVDKVEMEIVIEKQPGFLKFRAGEFEMAGVPKDYLPSVLPDGKLSPEYEKLGIKNFRQAKADITVQIFNLQDPVWGKSKDLRHAVALAIDVQKFIDEQYAGQAIRAHSIIDPTMYGYDPQFKSKWAQRDLAKAKELLAKAGYPEGKGLPPLMSPSSADTIARQFDERITRQLAEVGIVYKAEPMTWPEMMQRKQTGNFVMFGVGYSSGVPDVDDATGIVHSRNIANGHNAARYNNPAVDKLVDEIEAMTNGAERLAKIKKLQQILDDELPMITMVHRIGNQLVQPWVRNHVYTDNNFVGQFMKYNAVEPASLSK